MVCADSNRHHKTHPCNTVHIIFSPTRCTGECAHREESFRNEHFKQTNTNWHTHVQYFSNFLLHCHLQVKQHLRACLHKRPEVELKPEP